jgi:electron transfer flavoprotein beta subunit
MKIFVCIKQVPDPNTTVSKLDPSSKHLVRSGVSLVLDPGGETTIAGALKVRETVGQSELVAVSMALHRLWHQRRDSTHGGHERLQVYCGYQ